LELAAPGEDRLVSVALSFSSRLQESVACQACSPFKTVGQSCGRLPSPE
jgi:hypothetical protein